MEIKSDKNLIGIRVGRELEFRSDKNLIGIRLGHELEFRSDKNLIRLRPVPADVQPAVCVCDGQPTLFVQLLFNFLFYCYACRSFSLLNLEVHIQEREAIK